MPPTSERQRRAMYAAKEGNSTLGIPKSVGKEFVEADKGGKLPESKTPMKKGFKSGSSKSSEKSSDKAPDGGKKSRGSVLYDKGK